MAVKASTEEQITALLTGKASELVQQCVAHDMLGPKSYEEVFSLSKKEILDYLERHRRIEDVVFVCPGSRDGFYAVQTSSGFRTYEQYQGLKANDGLVLDEHEVWKKFVDYLVRTSGTGLTFE